VVAADSDTEVTQVTIDECGRLHTSFWGDISEIRTGGFIIASKKAMIKTA
jgi:hypothetical protein